MKNARGFTLIEILVATAISLIMLVAIGAAIESASRSSGGMERKVAAQQDVRAALELMAMEIRMASYNPVFANDNALWLNPATCAGFSANPAWKGIPAATANALTVEMDISNGVAGGDGNGLIMGGPAENNEVISYVYDVANLRIQRGTNCGGLQSFLGDVAGSLNRTVRVVNNAINIPVFRYFDGQGNLIPVDASGNIINAATQIPNIRMVEITLAVDTDEINPDTKQRRRMIYTTREILRNH